VIVPRLLLSTLVLLAAVAAPRFASAQTPTPSAACDLGAVEASRAEFLRLSTLGRAFPGAVSPEALSAASLAYVLNAEACFDALYGGPKGAIDEGGLMVSGEGQSYNLSGTKWGTGSPYSASGADNTGPHVSGGVVTYSFMGNGVDLTADSSPAPGPNVAITSLPNSSCFVADIAGAFAAWSAVASITFQQVADSGAPFNGAGAAGDIRIGAHVIDGASSVLAHGYYPPPNGTSAAGDIHFDVQENWSCAAASGIDIGIVALHEIGHALGLGHETRSARRAVMNPTYNPSVASVLLGDDINGIVNIYGSSIGATDDVLINFGSGNGLWRYDYGSSWSQVHGLAPEDMAVGDVDANGVDDIVIDFGPGNGVWIYRNGTTWSQLHGLSSSQMAVGDLDGNGRDDVVLDFPGQGIYVLFNFATWTFIHGSDPTLMTVANIDGTGGDDLVVNFPGQGVWVFKNPSTWSQINPSSADLIVAGRLDTAAGAEDLLISFTGQGLYQYSNGATWSFIHPYNPTHVAVGDLNSNGRDDVVIDFGPGIGLYTLRDGGTWSLLHGYSSRSVVMVDLDGNGQDEVVIDFGPGLGVWASVNGTTWLQIHSFAASGLAAGDFN
jgi:hypothetical protein